MADLNEHGPIVVGVDGSPSADEALEWAAAEAAASERPLHIVHGFIWPLMHVPLGPAEFGPADGGFQAAAERVLADAETLARSAATQIKVTTELVVGAADPVLLRQAEDAQLVVVGSCGLGGFAGVLVGSVGVKLAAHAACPVVVVRPRPGDRSQPSPPMRQVVVGADGSESSAAAIGFAFRAAAHHGAGLTVVRAWTAPVTTFPLLTVDRIEAEERQQMLGALDDQREQFPDVAIEVKLVRDDHPGHALVEESNNADLVVVGSRGRGGFTGLLLGSVSQTLLQHAGCPVAVVRPRQSGPPTSSERDRA